MTLSEVEAEVATLREKHGKGICTDVRVYGSVAEYTFMPDSDFGYRQEYDLTTGRERHCGLGRGCFWTEWE